MSEILDRYHRVAAGFTDRITAVPTGDDRWQQQSPCPDEHEVPDPPRVEDDPVAAWTATRDAMVAALDDPDIAGRDYEGFFGRTRWEESVDRFVSTDLVVHAWDLARALGVDDRLDRGEVRRVHETAKGFGDAMRAPGAFGPAIEPPPDATEQEALLAFLGRDPGA